jgi:hypothetical protein
MKMNNEHIARKGKSVVRTLFAGLSLAATFSTWAGVPADLTPSDFPPAYFDPADPALTPEWPGNPLHIDETDVDESLPLSEEAWIVPEASELRLPRPVKDSREFCRDCEFHIGVGGTYHSLKGTSGVVIPMTVTWDRSRWEFGVFRFASEQLSSETDQVIAKPYWGASLSRRFQFLDHGPVRAFFGFGVSYKTEQDVLSVTHWNFSSQLGVRFQPPNFPAIFELSARHWSNGGVRTPNRGQDFSILTVRFDL